MWLGLVLAIAAGYLVGRFVYDATGAIASAWMQGREESRAIERERRRRQATGA